MTNHDLFLKTVFACMACDGDIAKEEIQLVRDLIKNTDLFKDIDVEAELNKYIKQINEQGVLFLNSYLSEVAQNELSKEEQLVLVDLAFKTIEADNRIEYSEIKFFKKIRTRLQLTDDEILALYPDKEDYLLPDISVAEDPIWDNVTFNDIALKIETV